MNEWIEVLGTFGGLLSILVALLLLSSLKRWSTKR